jgi:hypothetical protein
MAREPETRVLLVGAAVTIGIGMVVYHVLEGWGWIDCLYFAVVTLATVGFGDLHPTNDPAKLFTVAYILTGVGILAAFVSELSRQRRAARVGHTTHHLEEPCPNCGYVAAEPGVEGREEER